MKRSVIFIGLVVLSVALFLAELGWGRADLGLLDALGVLFSSEASIAGHRIIVWDIRLPRAATAVVAGSGLALSGMLMQTYFRNPLAGPGVLGVSSGASLGVALMLLVVGGPSVLFRSFGTGGHVALALAAFSGALGVLLLVLAVAKRIGDPVTLLVVGLMVGYLVGSAIAVLEFQAEEGALKRFVVWGLGSFAEVGWPSWRILAVCWALALVVITPMVRHFDPLLLGDALATSMGVPVNRVRPVMLVVAGLLAGAITAACGPVAFLGLAVPHVARFLLGTGKHRAVIWGTVLCGTAIALACDLVARMPWSDQSLPLNAVTSLVGAPVVLALILRKRRLGRWL